MIVTAHQPNYLPGVSVIEKVRAADAVIWLDEVQYTHDGWSNRNRMPDGSWLTVPVDGTTDMGPYNRVRISDHRDWRRKHIRTLRQHYGSCWAIDDVAVEISRPYRLLIGLNLALLRVLLDDVIPWTPWHFQSHLDGGRAIPAVLEPQDDHYPISLRLASMVEELGGTVYLSGQSGRRYLHERPFDERGIEVRYFDWPVANPCALTAMAAVD